MSHFFPSARARGISRPVVHLLRTLLCLALLVGPLPVTAKTLTPPTPVVVESAGQDLLLHATGGRLEIRAVSDPLHLLAAPSLATGAHLTIQATPRQSLTLVGDLATTTLHLSTPARLVIEGTLTATEDLRLELGGLLDLTAGASLQAATVTLQADALNLAGTIRGEHVTLHARHIQHMGHIRATEGVTVQAGATYVATQSGHIAAPGGAIHLHAPHLFSSGRYDVSGPLGGDLRLEGETVILREARLDASGRQQGGRVVVWADDHADVTGMLRAGSSHGDGGFAEVSAAGSVAYAATSDVAAPRGQAGQFLLDPAMLVIDAATGVFPFYELVNPTPDAGDLFGAVILPLSTGRTVVTDPNDDAIATNAGAVYVYNTTTGALISTLTGSTAEDKAGENGVVALTNGNFVVVTARWDNGAVIDAGAVTWGSGTTGVAGSISSANSLVGAKANDFVGGKEVVALTNGNYLVLSPNVDSSIDAETNVGAITWANGATGRTGPVNITNSLMGKASEDRVGQDGAVVLPNGNAVVLSTSWDNIGINAAGAATFINGAAGDDGFVDASNSLIGANTLDRVGSGGIVILSNGNYLVHSPNWNGNRGAVSFGLATVGAKGVLNSVNSLVGATANDQIGRDDFQQRLITPLTNGNFVVASPFWDNGGTVNAGAATWGSGVVGVAGAVSAANSLVGTQAEDRVGDGNVTALTNGHYVVGSPLWNNGATVDVGAATWANGDTGLIGTVTTANSLHGVNANNYVGSLIYALSNGNYVAQTSFWSSGALTVLGAVTWGNGATGTTGPVTAANSLVGSTPGDSVGGVRVLTNGNYVVVSTLWDNGGIVNAGAVTWANGATGISGPISAANSLVGSTAEDQLGSGLVTALPGGNYVVLSPKWDNGAIVDAGAATWGSGTSGVQGSITAANSLVGSSTHDRVGSGVNVLKNGNYAVRSFDWDNGPTTNVGAVTWGNAATGVSGAVSAANSLIGSSASDQFGFGAISILEMDNGNYLVISPQYDGNVPNTGAVTLVNGTNGRTVDQQSTVTLRNSILGQAPNTGSIAVRALGNASGQTFVASFRGESGGRVRVGIDNPNLITNARKQGGELRIHPEFVLRTLRSGNVTMQATNTITVKGPLALGPSNNSRGLLTLQAGNKVLIQDALTMRLNDPAAGQSDQVAILGALELSGVTLNLSATNPLGPGQRFTLLSNDGADAVVGTFSGLAENANLTVGGTPMRITYQGGDGNDVEVFVLQAPAFTSTPILTGTVGIQYRYDADASGTPDPTYSLTTNPSGMAINAANGRITWTPAAAGSFPVTVQAANGVAPAATQSFTIVVSEQTGTVSGTVFADANGNGQQDDGESGLAGATITLTPAEGASVAADPIVGMTNANGAYSFSNVPVGTYSLSVSATGYVNPAPVEVAVAFNETTSVPTIAAAPEVDPTPDAEMLYLPSVRR